MTSKKTIAIVALIAMVTSVIGGFVVYASIAATLDIQGSAEFQPESWNVKFKAGTLQSDTTLTATIPQPPTLSDTVISDFRIVLTQPGDSARFTFFIENTGSLDAVLSTFTALDPSCVGTGATAVADAALVCGSHLTYTFRYIGGDLAVNGLSANSAVSLNDRLDAGTEVQVELRLEYSSAATAADLPENPVTIGNLGRTLVYSVRH